MKIRVLSVAYPFAPIKTNSVGGAERILSEMDQALVASGHTSVVVACEGSETAGSLYSAEIPRIDTLNDADRLWCRRRMQAAIDRAVGAHRFDVIHMHGLDFAEYTLPPRVPVVVSLHLPIPWYPPAIRDWGSGRVEFCCVSESQRRTCPPRWRAVRVIENGVPIPPNTDPPPRENYALVLGRICPEKNQHQALDAATQAGVKVLLAGQVFPYREHQEYFDNQIQPRLASSGTTPHHQFLGAITPERSQELLRRALCLLHPTIAPETSSLVAMEAMAVGTPVIAYRSGALPEIVTDGQTGYLVNTVDEMASALRHVDAISHERCRSEAEQRFQRKRMIRQYLELYEELVHESHQSLYA